MSILKINTIYKSRLLGCVKNPEMVSSLFLLPYFSQRAKQVGKLCKISCSSFPDMACIHPRNPHKMPGITFLLLPNSCTSFMSFRASWLKRQSTGFISVSRVYVYLSRFPLSKCILAPGVARPARLIGCLPCIPNALGSIPSTI